ncbi:serine carboxypeptidase s28 protein [Cystoisospora suis]|uniref:Serine carboxypeptidase s28 protein n=1 Tax=Cystoisospora suis TaxID=483139 RepID=A0A2C6KLN3_9APIC|nr:serine carboxypeptidase s28 protein [Cystoisospora suis]
MDRLSRLGPSGKRPLSCCLITIAVALLVLYCLVGEAKATGWYYRFMPVQREEHRRLLLAAGSSEALGGKQAQDDTNPLWLPFSVRRLPWGLVTEGSAQQQIERENQHIAVRPFRAPTADTREADGASATSGSFSLSLLERDVEEFWFEQPLDHGNPLIFNRPSHDEWKQKVFSAKVKSPCRSVDQHAGARRRIPGASPTGSEGSEYGTDRPQGSTDGRGRPTERKPDQFSRTDATPGSRDDTMEAYGHEQGVRPVFIYIGGEGPLSPLEVQAGISWLPFQLCVTHLSYAFTLYAHGYLSSPVSISRCSLGCVRAVGLTLGQALRRKPGCMLTG